MSAEIRQLVEAWAAALRAKDVDARTAHYAPDVVLFDVVDPLRHDGLDALRSRLAQWFSTLEGPLDCEIRDLEVTAGEDVAFCHHLARFRSTTLDMWVRYTICLRKVGGEWRVTHEHASVPFDPATGLASTAIRP